MLKTHWKLISSIERIADNVLVVLCFFASYYGRPIFLEAARLCGITLNSNVLELGPIDSYLLVLGLSLPLFNAALSILGAYRSMRLMPALELWKLGATAACLVFVSIGSVLFLIKVDLSRSFIGIFCVLSGLAIVTERLFILRLLRYFRARGKNFRNVLIVGTGVQARHVYTELLKQPELGLRVVGFVELARQESPAGQLARVAGNTVLENVVYDLPARVVADAASFEMTLKRYAVDEVFCTDVLETFSALKPLTEIAVEEGVRVSLAADLFSLEMYHSDMSYLGTLPFLHVHPSAGVHDGLALAVKRCLDFVLSLIALFVLFPIMLMIALAIKVSSKGPIFFQQKRIGLNGRQFVMLKFRTMVDGAEELLPGLLSKNEMHGPAFKIREDPRVTKVGRFLRRSSLDELPQLWNVLKGDMSLVGPRPPLPGEVSLYLRKHRKRLSMRPGLTCTWQISGRNEIPDFDEWANLDLEYIDTWSLRKDLLLLLRTIPVVLLGTGAR